MGFIERTLAKFALKKAINRLVKYLKTEKMNSSKTTIGGIIGGLALVLTQVWYAIDADPATVLNFDQILAGLSLMGIGWFARDNDKSSEDVGAK